MPLFVTYWYVYQYVEPINVLGLILLIAAFMTIYLKETYSTTEEKSEQLIKNEEGSSMR